MKLIKLHIDKDNSVWINAEKILYILNDENKNKTKIALENNKYYFYVLESVGTVVRLINGSKIDK